MKNFRYDDASHVYTYCGKIIPHNTAILAEAGIVSYELVREWILERARWRGKAVHVGAELIDAGTLDWDDARASFDQDIVGRLESYLQFKEKHQFKPELVEMPLCDPDYLYGTKIDAAGPSDLGLLLLERKTGIEHPGVALQLAGQKRVLPKWWLNGRKIRRAALYLKPDGYDETRDLRFFDDDQGDEKVFLMALGVSNWLRAHGLVKTNGTGLLV